MKKIIGIGILMSAIIITQAQISGSSDLQARTEINQTNPKTVKLKVTGMTCAGCSSHVTTALKKVEGVISVDLIYPGDVATVSYDAEKTNTNELIDAVEKINYKAKIVKEDEK